MSKKESQLSPAQEKQVLHAIQQLKEGKTKSHAEVMKMSRAWIQGKISRSLYDMKRSPSRSKQHVISYVTDKNGKNIGHNLHKSLQKNP